MAPSLEDSRGQACTRLGAGKGRRRGRVRPQGCSEALAQGKGSPARSPLPWPSKLLGFQQDRCHSKAGLAAPRERGEETQAPAPPEKRLTSACWAREIPESRAGPRARRHLPGRPPGQRRSEAPGRLAAPLAAGKGAWPLPARPRGAACPGQPGKMAKTRMGTALRDGGTKRVAHRVRVGAEASAPSSLFLCKPKGMGEFIGHRADVPPFHSDT